MIDWGGALQDASENFRRDKGVVLSAVPHHKYALRYASEELQREKEVVLAAHMQLAAVQNIDVYYDCISEEMQRDPDVLLVAATAHDHFLDDFLRECKADDALRDDIQFITGLINAHSAIDALDFASEVVRADRQVVLAAVSKDPAALRFVCDGGYWAIKKLC